MTHFICGVEEEEEEEEEKRVPERATLCKSIVQRRARTMCPQLSSGQEGEGGGREALIVLISSTREGRRVRCCD